MSSVRLRRIAATATTAAALLVLAGCGTGFGAQTNQPYNVAVGSIERGETIEVLNALFVDNGNDTATFSATLLNKGTTAHLLQSVDATTNEGAPIASTLTGPLELKPQTPYTPGKTGDIMLTGAFPAGGFVKITLSFEGAAPVTIDAPVVTRTAVYDSVAEKTTVVQPTANASGPITIADARFVLGPSGKAFLGATVTSTSKTDETSIPTATGDIKLLHQTETGGPGDIVAAAGRSLQIGVRGNTTGDNSGDGYYVVNVKVGDTVTLTFPFASGRIIVKAPVVAAG